MALLLPAGYEVPAFSEFGQESRHFRGIVLQIAIQGENHVTGGQRETILQGGGFSEVAAEFHSPDRGVGSGQFLQKLPGSIAAAVVDNDDLVAVGAAAGNDFRNQLTQGVLFVEHGDDKTKQHHSPVR